MKQLSTPDTILKIHDAIKDWDNLRKSPNDTINFFDKFTYFGINRTLLNSWVENLQLSSIHAYLGIYNNDPYIFLVDDVADDPQQGEVLLANIHPVKCVQSKNFLINFVDDIVVDTVATPLLTVEEFRKRSLRWSLCQDYYLNILSEGSVELGFAFHIPLDEFRSSSYSDNVNNDDCMLSIGIEGPLNTNAETWRAELLIWNLYSSQVGPHAIGDYSYPVPPYEGETYQLHVDSTQ
jgi:hypothetical protein